jgi:hypothetical protein
MTFEAIIEKFKARRCGRTWLAHCPGPLHAHGDRHPSLSIAEGREGRVLVKCFVGCTVEEICAAAGLRVRDLFVGQPPNPKLQPLVLRAAERIASEGMQHHRRAVREEPITVIFADATAIDTAIARALALTVEGKLCQIAVKE